jgi:hypothetical protein
MECRSAKPNHSKRRSKVIGIGGDEHPSSPSQGPRYHSEGFARRTDRRWKQECSLSRAGANEQAIVDCDAGYVATDTATHCKAHFGMKSYSSLLYSFGAFNVPMLFYSV